MRQYPDRKRGRDRNAQIDGRNFHRRGRHRDGADVYVTRGRVKDPPPEYHVSTPIPDQDGFRLFWVFLAVVVIGAIILFI